VDWTLYKYADDEKEPTKLQTNKPIGCEAQLAVQLFKQDNL